MEGAIHVKDLHKRPGRRRPGGMQAYASEYILVDSTTSAIQACGGCHPLSQVHGRVKTTVSNGVGVDVLLGSASVTVNSSGDVSASWQAGQGSIVGVTTTVPLNPGPKIVVAGAGLHGTRLNAGTRRPSIGGTTSAAADKTRTH